jgi:ribosome-associated toxin RatA of RatAB toxin-antitoxin module
VITVDRRLIHADLRRLYGMACDVERWPEWLPHYRWVRFHRRHATGGLVEMSANRPFGPVDWPTWWLSEMTLEPGVPRVRYRHVDGVTTGMDVAWEFAPLGGAVEVTITHRWAGPGWPLIGAFAAAAVIGPVFVHGIASRTLEGIARRAEGSAG